MCLPINTNELKDCIHIQLEHAIAGISPLKEYLCTSTTVFICNWVILLRCWMDLWYGLLKWQHGLHNGSTRCAAIAIVLIVNTIISSGDFDDFFESYEFVIALLQT